YYAWIGNAFVFASEVKAFLALPGFTGGLDLAALGDYMTVGYAVAPRTIFAGVSKLPPATLLRWQGGRVEMQRYWSPPEHIDQSLDAEEWADRIRAEVERAVESHMVS